MKIPNFRRRSGFTLVELLVVIAIIAILASVGVGVAITAMEKGKKTATLTVASAVEANVNNFFNEYGYMPVPASTSADTAMNGISTSDQQGKDVLTILLAMETTSPPLNSKGMKMLSVPEGKAKGANSGIKGLVYNSTGSTIVGLFDWWGGGFKIVMDGDFDEKITVRPKGATNSKTLNGRRVACWSDGADGAGSSNGKSSDDVITWSL